MGAPSPDPSRLPMPIRSDVHPNPSAEGHARICMNIGPTWRTETDPAPALPSNPGCRRLRTTGGRTNTRRGAVEWWSNRAQHWTCSLLLGGRKTPVCCAHVDHASWATPAGHKVRAPGGSPIQRTPRSEQAHKLISAPAVIGPPTLEKARERRSRVHLGISCRCDQRSPQSAPGA